MSKLQEGQVILPKSRLSYPHLWVAEAVKGETDDSKKRFGCNILLPKTDEATKAKIDIEIKRIAKERMKGVPPKTKDISIKDGDGEDGDEHSAGCWVISANRYPKQGRPQVIDGDRTPLAEADCKPKAGDYCNYLVGIYNPKSWPGKICFSLEIVQFAGEGPPIGAGTADSGVMPDMGGADDGYEV